MFVQKNNVQAIKKYFRERLEDKFSQSEIKLMVRECVCRRLGLSFSDYLTCDQALLSESDLLYFRSVLKRLQNNEPFQYITGYSFFYGLEIKTDSRALIPRPETEELVDWIVHDFSNNSNIAILDLCTGTGCIALALKSKFSNSEITAIDVSIDALSLVEENSIALNLDLDIIQADLLENSTFLRFIPNSFDCWVSNPPYIPEQDKSKMLSNVLDHEPHIALFVKDYDPLVFYRTIASKGMEFLKQKGRIYFEIHEQFGEELLMLLRNIGFVNMELRKDLQGRNRMLMAQKP